MEETALTRLYAIADPTEVRDPEYVQGLRGSLTIALEFAMQALELGEPRSPDVPYELIVQARLASRGGVPLSVVLRRYLAGYALFCEFALEEAANCGAPSAVALHPLVNGQASIFDRLIKAVSEAYCAAQEAGPSSPDRRRLERVASILAGNRSIRPSLTTT